MATDIQVTSLLAAGGAGTITLSAYAASPAGMACLPYMQAVKIEFWVSTSNNRNNATKLGESEVGILVHSGLGENVTRYYWARAVDADGNFSDFYPTSGTGGVAATTATMTPGPNSIGSSQIQPNAVQTTHIANAAITDAKISNLSASKITAGTISATISITGPTITGGTITGGTIRTSSGANRVEMSAANNSLSIYSGGGEVVRLGPSPNAIWEGSISARASSSVAVLAYSLSSTNIPALRVVTLASTGVACTVNGNTSGVNAIVATHNSGGQGLVGVNNADGGYAFYAMRGSYGPFTGSHDALILADDPAELGDLVVDVRVLQRSGFDDVLTEVASSTEERQRGVVGVITERISFDPMSEFAAFPAPKDHRKPSHVARGIGEAPQPGILRRRWAKKYHRVKMNSLGEGQMNVCGRGGNIQKGDLICASSMRGKGQCQDDDLVHSWTAARAREDVIFDHPDEVKRVAVIYLCG